MKSPDLPTSTSHFSLGKSAKIAVLALFITVLGLLGVLAKTVWLKPHSHDLLNGSFLPQPRQIAEFDLISEDGTPLTSADLLGHWTVVFAGYTYCPEICPTTLSKLKAAKDQLGDDAQQLTVLFLSIDPEHDTPGQLASYIHNFDPDFRAATGSAIQLEALATNLGVVALKIPDTEHGTVAIDHSARLILVNPEGKMAGYLSPPFTTQELVTDFKTVLATQ